MEILYKSANEIYSETPLRLASNHLIMERARLLDAQRTDEERAEDPFDEEEAEKRLHFTNMPIDLAKATNRWKINILSADLKLWFTDYSFGDLTKDPEHGYILIYNELDYMAREEYTKWYGIGDRTYRILLNIKDEYPDDTDLHREFSGTFHTYRSEFIEPAIKATGLKEYEQLTNEYYTRLIGVVHHHMYFSQTTEEFVDALSRLRDWWRDDVWFKNTETTEVAIENTWQEQDRIAAEKAAEKAGESD